MTSKWCHNDENQKNQYFATNNYRTFGLVLIKNKILSWTTKYNYLLNKASKLFWKKSSKKIINFYVIRFPWTSRYSFQCYRNWVLQVQVRLGDTKLYQHSGASSYLQTSQGTEMTIWTISVNMSRFCQETYNLEHYRVTHKNSLWKISFPRFKVDRGRNAKKCVVLWSKVDLKNYFI